MLIDRSITNRRVLVAVVASLIGASGGAAQVRMSLPGSRPAMAPRGGQAMPQRFTPRAPANRPAGFQQGMRPAQVQQPPSRPAPATNNFVLPNGGLVFQPQTVVGGAPISPRGFEPVPNGGFGTINGSGLTVNGAYKGDNWKLGFHLGSGFPAVPRAGSEFCWPVPCQPICPPVAVWPANPYWGFPWWGYGGYAYDGYRYDEIYGNYSPPDPGLVSTAQVPPPVTETPRPSTDRELGDGYLQAGDANAAIKSYRAFLKVNPGDVVAIRSMSFALLELGQPAEAAAMMSMAYRTNPYLASVAVSPDMYKGGIDGFRKNLQRMSIYANKTQSPSAWLALTVMMQAEGRNDLARTMLERARTAGLPPTVAEKMLTALQG